jgi:hypothetical protein
LASGSADSAQSLKRPLVTAARKSYATWLLLAAGHRNGTATLGLRAKVERGARR